MKKQILSIIIGTIVLTFLFGTLQAQTVTLTFTGKDANNQYVQLNRVAITNLTKGWQETIYWPDTTLTMQNSTGIGESVANGGFGLSQNNPNPFTGTTDVNLTVADAGTVTLEITDGNGRIAVETTHALSLQSGTHQFRVSLSAAGTYVMTARQNGKMSSIKMVCNGAGNGNVIEYIGIVETPYYDVSTMITTTPKSHTRGVTTNPFNFGDQMEYVGYATINGEEYESLHVTKAQETAETIVLQFAEAQRYIPTVITTIASNISDVCASCGGNVVSDGGDSVIARGVCWSTSPAPVCTNSHTTDGGGTGIFVSDLTGLRFNTTYYVRAFATNSIGTAYGNEVSFTTTYLPFGDAQPCPGLSTLTDIDGNVYSTVKIGNQCWMKENLRSKRYSDNTPITHGSQQSDDTPYWYYPANDSSYMLTFGLLYNWAAAMYGASSNNTNPSGVQGICPSGWHMPSHAEWLQLINHLREHGQQYGCLGQSCWLAKSLASTTAWQYASSTCHPGNDPSTNNTSGFSAFPAEHYGDNHYYGYGQTAFFWSTTIYESSNNPYIFKISCFEDDVIIQQGINSWGFSVRCLKD